ncbi:glucanase b [Niveomyces insectorum RCEF 264]|uniref:Glucanase b n=1 Tax=Niveomyces insectorum RCEF 264 TaxID=1081102 RepID=A0A162MQF9_9HYPO|nr:glucanase b [Niveomyces insectorum RCEF 264]
MPDSLVLHLQNQTRSSDVFAYVTGLALQHNNARVFVAANGRDLYFPQNPADPAATLQPLAADVAIPLGPPGHIVELTFLLNPGGPGGGAALVEPSVLNPSDANAGVDFAFAEFTLNADQLFANISYVDFVPRLPIALTLQHARDRDRDRDGSSVGGGGAPLVVGGEAFSRPTTADIFGCNSGPFVTRPGAAVRNAVIPRLAAAFQRGTLLTSAEQPAAEADAFYRTDPTNHYSRLVHAANVDGKGYAFAYDDVQADGGPDQSGKDGRDGESSQSGDSDEQDDDDDEDNEDDGGDGRRFL